MVYEEIKDSYLRAVRIYCCVKDIAELVIFNIVYVLHIYEV